MNCNEIIDEKEVLVNELSKATSELLIATIEYKKVQNMLWLDTDFSEALNSKRPTVDEKKAFISQHSLMHKEQKEKAYNKVQELKLQIELCDDKLRVCSNE